MRERERGVFNLFHIFPSWALICPSSFLTLSWLSNCIIPGTVWNVLCNLWKVTDFLLNEPVSQQWTQFSWLPQAGHLSNFLLSRNWRYFLIGCKQDREKGHVLVWCLSSKLVISSFNLPIVTWELIPSFVFSVLRSHAVERMLEAVPSFYANILPMHIYMSGKYHNQGRS